MTTVHAVYDSDGCVGRCDAKCHNAKGDVCHCICGGLNHGCGFAQARENIKKLTDVYLKENLAKPHEKADLRVFCSRDQLLMFET